MIKELTNRQPVIDFGFGITAIDKGSGVVTVWQNTLYHPQFNNPVIEAEGAAEVTRVSPYEWEITYDDSGVYYIRLTLQSPFGNELKSNMLTYRVE